MNWGQFVSNGRGVPTGYIVKFKSLRPANGAAVGIPQEGGAKGTCCWQTGQGGLPRDGKWGEQVVCVKQAAGDKQGIQCTARLGAFN
jgi:hypothetical protein